MRQIGLRAEILVNILFITAVAMFLIGIIAFKLTEKFALQGKVESIRSIIIAAEESYFAENDIEDGIEFLKEVLNPGAWGVIARGNDRILFSTSEEAGAEGKTDPLILQVLSSGDTLVDIEGVNFPPFSTYKGFKIATPVKISGRPGAALLISQPLSRLEENMVLSQRLIALWIILFLIIIALFGFYMLSRRIIKPVHELIKTTEKIAGGKFPENADIGAVKEINQLYSALRIMYGEIEDGKGRLRDKIRELEEMNTELKLTQRELIAAEKMASLGQLSAGIAHEIGNPLSAINGYVDVLKRAHNIDEDKKKVFLNDIQREVDRVDKIIKTLLEYSRPKNPAPKFVDLNQVIRDSVDVVRSQGVLKNISLSIKLSEDIPLVEADPGQISQVIINLILNSRDAIPESGEIVITTSAVSDSGARIAVSDNGTGISTEILNKIFDPFFTTKEPGQGTGLGLSVSARIVETFGGTIGVRNTEGGGAVFEITLPAVKDYKNAENFGN